MKTHGIASLAQILAISSNAPVILIQAINNGTGGRVRKAFPSLDQDAVDLIEDAEPVVLRFDDAASACAAFDLICSDLDEESTLISGEIQFIRPDGQTTGFDIAHDKERPVVSTTPVSSQIMLSRI